MPNEKPKAREPRVPMTRKIDRKIVAFDPGLASDLISLQSVPYAIDSLTFWARQIVGRLACPECGVVGSLRTTIEPYGTVTDCRRAACCYLHEQLFSSKATQ